MSACFLVGRGRFELPTNGLKGVFNLLFILIMYPLVFANPRQ